MSQYRQTKQEKRKMEIIINWGIKNDLVFSMVIKISPFLLLYVFLVHVAKKLRECGRKIFSTLLNKFFLSFFY